MSTETTKPAIGGETDAAEEAELRLCVTVTDPDVVGELRSYTEGDERDRFALKALRVGVLAIAQARGQIDSQTIRNEGERILSAMSSQLQAHQDTVTTKVASTLKEYFDPTDGRFSERVRSLIAKDGELERLLRERLDGEDSTLGRTLADQVGSASPLMRLLDPNTKDGLVEQLSRAVDDVVTENQKAVVGQFDMNDPQSALRRFIKSVQDENLTIEEALRKRVAELAGMLSLDVPDSALARVRNTLVKALEESEERNQTFREEVKVSLAEMAARKQESERGTTHGLDYEEALFAFIEADATATGDISTRTGETTGLKRNCKKGDCTVTLGPEHAAAGATIVIEAKASGSYDLKRALEEMDEARKNRGAEFGVFVTSPRTASSDLPAFKRYGRDFVVRWDDEDPSSDVYLVAALSAARYLCTAASPGAASGFEDDFQAIDEAIIEIEKKTDSLEEIRTTAETIKKGTDKILERVRIVQDALNRQVGILRARVTEIDELRPGEPVAQA